MIYGQAVVTDVATPSAPVVDELKVISPDQLDAALDQAFAHDGPSLVEVMIDPRATPIHSFRRRMADPSPKAPVRPGTVYELRHWKLACDLPDRTEG